MTTPHQPHDPSEDIDRWLKKADPASHLTPLLPWQLEHLKDNTMTSPTTSTSRRRRVLGLAGSGVAAAAVLSGIIISTSVGAGSVTALTSTPAGGPAAMCAELTPEALATSTLAFRATVTGISDNTVTLRVDDVFTGDVENTVTLPQGDPDNQLDGAQPVFENDQTYLIATTDTTIRTCGATGTDSTALTTIYQQAFPQ